MTPSLHLRLTARLCLALLLLTGLSPAQGFVVCIEDDGCVSVEFKAAEQNCAGCHEGDEAPGEPAGDEACPCIDLELPGSIADQLAQPRSFEIELGSWAVPPLDIHVPRPTMIVTALRGPPLFARRAAESLAHVRTVVLLV